MAEPRPLWYNDIMTNTSDVSDLDFAVQLYEAGEIMNRCAGVAGLSATMFTRELVRRDIEVRSSRGRGTIEYELARAERVRRLWEQRWGASHAPAH